MALNTLDIFLYTFFSSLTIISSGFIILTYIFNKELQQHPAGLLAVLSVFEIIMGYHNIIYAIGIYKYSNSLGITQALSFALNLSITEIEQSLCFMNQLILCASLVGILISNIIICFDLMLTLWNPLYLAASV